MAQISGYGLGLRHPHYDTVMQDKPAVDWFEILSDNYLHAHRGYWEYLIDLRADYPLAMHGVSLSIGGVDPLDADYLMGLRQLADTLAIDVVSDHLCFTSLAGQHSHDLLPIPYTEAALAQLIPRVQQVQDALNRPLVLENASTYLQYAASSIPEAEFLAELCRRSGCGLLLDINNVYVSSSNHGWDMHRYLSTLPADAIRYCHLAGHTQQDALLIDTHNRPVCDAVWALYEHCIAQMGPLPTLIEWDEDIPPFNDLMQELEKAKSRTRCIQGITA